MKKPKIHTSDWISGLVIGLCIGLFGYLWLLYSRGTIPLMTVGGISITAALCGLLLMPTIKRDHSE